ncbi:YeiH family protein [Luethyella okanaganae]|uniref:YeiH family protein n=1 Tax=Luethyella okanaganae TaxID=69372 RepID=A0ABW1VDQ9_9MICO
MPWLPGVLLAGAAALTSWGIHTLIPVIPLLTAAIALGIVVGQLPIARPALGGSLAPGISVASKGFMRLGVVLLGLKLSLTDIAGLGWPSVLLIVGVVLLAFVGTIGLGRTLGLPGHQPLLVATGFSICGASAIGAMSGVVRAKDEETATPVALVTLCGTLAIAVLPLLWHPLGLTNEQFGHWVGASVHDVGQVIATAQIAGPAALAVAIVVKLTRIVMLAPMVAIVASIERRRHIAAVANDDDGERPPIVPLFVLGFLAMILVRTLLPVPDAAIEVADAVQTALLAMALFGLGSAVRLSELMRTGWRALLVGLLSWALIAALALAAVVLS